MERSLDSSDDIKLNLVPDGYPELVFHLNNPFFFLSEKDQKTQHPKTGIIGQLTQSFEMKASPGDKAFFVKLYPWVPYFLFNTPVHLFNDKSVELENLDTPPIIRDLSKNIRSSANISEMIDHFESYFLTKIQGSTANPLLEFSIKKVFQKSGNLQTQELSQGIKVSKRYLEILFKKELGLSPKRYARLIKIKKMSIQLSERTDINLAQFANEWGYFDQSHFIKDFKSVTLQTPKQFLNYQKEFPIQEKEIYLNQWDYS
jgi:AraC-like DNA-binding protein